MNTTNNQLSLSVAIARQLKAQERFDAIKRSLGAERATRLAELWQANAIVEQLQKETNQ
jgi:hypothetical protein